MLQRVAPVRHREGVRGHLVQISLEIGELLCTAAGLGEQEEGERIDDWGRFSEHGVAIFVAQQRAADALDDPAQGAKQVQPGSVGVIRGILVVASKPFDLKQESK